MPIVLTYVRFKTKSKHELLQFQENPDLILLHNNAPNLHNFLILVKPFHIGDEKKKKVKNFKMAI